MESLALEISKILNITVEKAIELMPVIRKQFIWYEAVNGARMLIGITMAVCALVWWISVEEEWEKIIITSSILFVLSMIAFSFTFIILPFLAPDFMMIKEFIL